MSTPALELYRYSATRAFLIADVLLYHDLSEQPPPLAPWAEYLDAVSTRQAQIERCLIVPSRGGLTAHQREQVRRLIAKRPTAVLTDSALNRGIITSLTWFGVPIHAFRPGEYRAALSWLGRETLLPEVQRLLGARAEAPRGAGTRADERPGTR
jgi:hypothetical protein